MHSVFWSLYAGAWPQVLATLGRITATERVTQGPADDAQRVGFPVQVVGNVAIVSLMGPMIRRASRFAQMFGIVGTDDVRRAVEAAATDDDIEHIVLRVDSPGGSVDGVHELSEAIAGAGKPVTAIVEGMCCSAAYHVSAQADRLLVGANDLVGSIGVRMLMFDESKAFERLGIETVAIDTGEFKSAGAPGLEITDAQRADFQRIVDFYFDGFVDAVAAGRGLSREAVLAVADGRVFPPSEAEAAGLVDGVSTLDAVMAELRSRPARSSAVARARLQL